MRETSELNYKESLEKDLKQLLEQQNKVSTNEVSLENANTLSKIGLTYGKLGDSIKELRNVQKGLEIKRKVFGHEGDHLDVVNELINLGNAYSHNGEYKYELNYKAEGLRMFKRLMESGGEQIKSNENNLLYAKCLSEVALAYRNNDDHLNELKYQIEAYRLRVNDPELAAETVDLIGQAYGNNGDYKRELKFKLEALIMRTRIYRNNELNLKIADSIDS